MESARVICYAEISAGETCERDYVITPEVYKSFLAAFDDRSPLHVDEQYARTRGFDGMVMHGAILNGFVSHFVGMVFPGANSLLLAVDLRFAQPSYLGDKLRLTAKVAQKLDAQRVIELHVNFLNSTRGRIATGRVQVKVGGT